MAFGALATGLAACGGGSSSATSASTSTSAPPTTTAGRGGGANTAALQKYTQCLTSHGVPASAAGGLFGRRPGSGTGSGTATSPPSSRVPGTRPTIPAQYQAAFQACSSLRPTFGGGGFGGAGGFNSAQFAAYRNCLQIHGVTLPTTPTTKPGQTSTTSGTGQGGFGRDGGLTNSPAFQAASKACANLLPARTGSSTTTTVPAAS